MDTATTRALARLADLHGRCTDYRLSQLMGVTQQTVSMYRTGRRQLDDALAVKVADMIGAPPAQLLAEIQAERSKDEGARAHWLRLAALARAACLVAAISAGLLVGGQVYVTRDGAELYPSNASACIEQNDIQCVQFSADPAGPAFAFLVGAMLLILGGFHAPRSRDETSKKKRP